ncbi:hypothetical protein DIZ81_02390 [Legionella taurinensis]|uniref:Major outer membrane protein n=1 Tax=Legionella taurinensis TaxID=70611 RepID=A0A3A5LDY9_9GAMM|nr:Lpg1974 family pore-forming outer membrane protein [Legionella taurinensis]MDX1836278.1 Lpg1974 family pore-forming outer membrane protein [Legionella taurinensis]PUT41965.1 hypothetical protein DB744_02395 [Legionella taurinensis]PUT44754.1 hypothetical protein DB746_02395 [Legionella taurinensis]PUT48074.1 hypothetical protein DB743_00555 [Legionella taurinensis]PUT48889.1 hypothetical protein DB745_02395 [Legionella taurinensis]
MKYFVKKTACLAWAFAFAAPAFSGTMGAAEDQGHHFFFSVAPFYGAITDEGINKLVFAEQATPTGQVTAFLPDGESDWGYTLSLGYAFDPNHERDLVLTYSHLSTETSKSIAVGEDGLIINRLSQLANFGPQYVRGPASAGISADYEYQTADLITNHYFPSEQFNRVEFSRFYGIKATEFRKGFTADYNGRFINVIAGTNVPSIDNINYSAKYYGIGPRIGMGGKWRLNRIFSVGGDVSASILVGSYKNEWNETLSVDTLFLGELPPGPFHSYTQVTNSRAWVSPVLAGNLAVAADFDVRSANHIRFEGGIGSEQYLPHLSPDSYRAKEGDNVLYIPQHFSIRNVFIKFTYFC